jgi:hypothetical protein
MSNEHLGLTLTADVTQWDRAFSLADERVESLGKTVEKTRDGFDDMFDEAERKAKSLGGAIGKGADAWGNFEKKAESALKKTEGYEKGISAINQKLELFNKLINLGGKAIELAKFSDEFRRLERAVPAEKMRELNRETQGTVSKFDLLQRAAKEMNLSATAGMDAQSRALARTLTDWQNFFDGAKVAVGDWVGGAITWLDRLSDRLAGVQSTLEDTARANVRERAAAKRPSGILGMAAVPAELADYADPDAVAAELAALQATQRRMAAAAIRKDIARDGKAIADQANAAKYAARALHLSRGDGATAAPAETKTRGGGRGGKGDTLGSSFRGFDVKGDGGGWTSPTGGLAGINFDSFMNPSFGADGAEVLFDATGGAVAGGAPSGMGAMGEAFAGGAAKGVADKAKAMADFAKDLQDTNTAIGASFSVVSAGITAAVDAAISGSESIGRAVMKASAMALKAIAIEQTVRALAAGALAIGSIATGNPAGAAAFGKQAAMHAAAAAAAGIGSAALGSAAGGGGGVASGPSAAPGGGNARLSGGGGSSSGPATTNIHIHGKVSASTHRQLGTEMSKALRRGKTSGNVESDENTTTHFE